MRVAFVGLGVMGFPMAGYLAKAGHEVAFFNRTAARAESWLQKHAGTRAMTAGEAAANAEIVFCCVGNDDDVRTVILGEHGILEQTRPGSIIVDATSMRPPPTKRSAFWMPRCRAGRPVPKTGN